MNSDRTERQTGNGAAGGTPQSTAEARRAINETRGRIASDLDAVEAGLVAKKRALTEKMKLDRARSGIRQHPWWSVAAGLGVGLLLGAIRSISKQSESEKKHATRHHWRQRRREHLEHRAAETAKSQKASGHAGTGASTLGTLGGAAAAGLADRVKRKGFEVLRGR